MQLEEAVNLQRFTEYVPEATTVDVSAPAQNCRLATQRLTFQGGQRRSVQGLTGSEGGDGTRSAAKNGDNDLTRVMVMDKNKRKKKKKTSKKKNREPKKKNNSNHKNGKSSKSEQSWASRAAALPLSISSLEEQVANSRRQLCGEIDRLLQ